MRGEGLFSAYLAHIVGAHLRREGLCFDEIVLCHVEIPGTVCQYATCAV